MYSHKQKKPQASWKVGYDPQEKTIARMTKAIRRWVHPLPMDTSVLKLLHSSTAALSLLVLLSTTVVWGSDVHLFSPSDSDSNTASKADSRPPTNVGGTVCIFRTHPKGSTGTFVLKDSETQALENGEKPSLKNCTTCLKQCENLSW